MNLRALTTSELLRYAYTRCKTPLEEELYTRCTEMVDWSTELAEREEELDNREEELDDRECQLDEREAAIKVQE